MVVSSLTIYITERCNLNCYYCFAHKSNRDIDLDTAIASVEFLINESKDARSINILFFGGEPLLKFDLIKQIVNYARIKAGMSGKSVSFEIITNGTLITPEMADLFKDNLFKIAISWDGDRKRIEDVKGRKTYEEMIDSLRVLKDKEIPAFARASISPEDMRLVDFAKSAKDSGFRSIKMTPIFFSKLDPSKTEERMIELADYFIESVKNNQPFLIQDILDPLMMLMGLKEKGDRPCEVGSTGLTIDVEGRIFPCTHLHVWEKELVLGNVFGGKVDETLRKTFTDFSIKDIIGCEDCPARASCCGICIAHNYEKNKDFRIPEKELCVWNRAVHKAATHILEELYSKEKNHSFIEWMIKLNSPWITGKWAKGINIQDIGKAYLEGSNLEFYFNLGEQDLEYETGRKVLVFLDKIKKKGTVAILKKPIPPCIFDAESKKIIDAYNLPSAIIDLNSRNDKFKKAFIELFKEYKLFAKMPKKCMGCELRLNDRCHYAYFGFSESDSVNNDSC